MSRAELPPERLRWYVLADSKVFGPFDRRAIAEMVHRNQLLGDDQIHTEGGSEWIAAKQDPQLASLFRENPLAPKLGKPKRKMRWARVAITIAILATTAWIAWPYYALFSLITAVRQGDVPTLERCVDWNSVRQALRGDLNAHLLKKATDTTSDDAMASGLAAVIGPAFVNNLVDAYVTPQAIAAMVRNEKPVKRADDLPTIKGIDHVKEIDWEKIKYAFFTGGPFSFRVDLLNEKVATHPVGLELAWNGDWRLVRLVLPPDFLTSSSSNTERAGTSSGEVYNKEARESLKKLLSSNTSKASVSAQPPKVGGPSPVELVLLTKKYRDVDFRAGPYVPAAITFDLSIVNKTNQPIRAFDGVIVFTDLLDNELLSTKFASNDPVGANATVKWSGGIEYNQFMNSHSRLRNEAMQNIKISFKPRKVLYADGSTKEFD